ncbi:hypothetical protein [Actinophytocola sp.]|uniref:ATP-binding protein n=1 Tax=Actinophytocola sp. TaxID=1872138 RepID=UPI00389ADBD4
MALKEDDLLVGAALRQKWEVPGPWTDQLLPFRDKYLMATLMSKAGVAVPEFAMVHDEPAVLAFADRVGWPVIVKPTLASSSAGVARRRVAGRTRGNGRRSVVEDDVQVSGAVRLR